MPDRLDLLLQTIVDNKPEEALRLINTATTEQITYFSEENGTPLLAAIDRKYVDIIKALLARSDINEIINLPSGPYKFTPLLSALLVELQDIALQLIPFCTIDCLNSTDATGSSTSLEIAITKGYTDVTIALLHKGANIKTIKPETIAPELVKKFKAASLADNIISKEITKEELAEASAEEYNLIAERIYSYFTAGLAPADLFTQIDQLENESLENLIMEEFLTYREESLEDPRSTITVHTAPSLPSDITGLISLRDLSGCDSFGGEGVPSSDGEAAILEDCYAEF